MCDCQGKTYNIAMCCEPQIKLGPIENYYTKPATDRRIQEEISGISAVTIDEVQEMIDESISGISGVTEEEMNNAIASAKTEIEAEIPSLDGYATEEYVNTQISAETGDFIDGEELSSYTYDKATIDSKIGSGGTGITSGEVQTMIDSSISGKTDTSAFTTHTSDTTVHVTSAEKTTWNSKQDVLTAGTGVNISGNVISMKIWSGTKAQFDAITVKDNETIYLVTD